jgi:hypothetical protein
LKFAASSVDVIVPCQLFPHSGPVTSVPVASPSIRGSVKSLSLPSPSMEMAGFEIKSYPFTILEKS